MSQCLSVKSKIETRLTSCHSSHSTAAYNISDCRMDRCPLNQKLVSSARSFYENTKMSWSWVCDPVFICLDFWFCLFNIVKLTFCSKFWLLWLRSLCLFRSSLFCYLVFRFCYQASMPHTLVSAVSVSRLNVFFWVSEAENVDGEIMKGVFSVGPQYIGLMIDLKSQELKLFDSGWRVRRERCHSPKYFHINHSPRQ